MAELSKNEIERQERQRAAGKRRVKRAVIWILVVAVIAAAGYGLVLWSKKSSADKPGFAIAELSRDHIPDGQEVAEYNSNPPTSGPHYAQPADWGVYEQPLLDERLVHNLEHGGIWLSYRDADDTALTAQLRDIADDYTLKVIMTPRPENDARIAVAAWGRLLKLESFDREQIEDFIGAFINRGPEQTPY